MTETKSMPTAEQLRDYVAKLPAVYREVLVAIQNVDPYRRQGEGVFESSVRNYYSNRHYLSNSTTTSTTTTPDPNLLNRERIPIGGNIDPAVRDDFGIVIDRLADAGFLIAPEETRFGMLVPTELGEALIAAITGRRAPIVEVPELPPQTW